MKKILFSDMDGTLCFHEKLHGIQRISFDEDGDPIVFDPGSQAVIKAKDLSTTLYRCYCDKETLKLARRLKDKYFIVFVSGARLATMKARRPVLDFADAYILENGGLILDRTYGRDEAWSSIIEGEKPNLYLFKHYLSAMGWIQDDFDRTTATRIRKEDNPHKSQDEFEELCQNIKLPPSLKKTKNVGNLDIILAATGKDRAIKYLMEKEGISKEHSVGIGDDINDIEMLCETGMSFVVSSPYSEIHDVARRLGWYVSVQPHFRGINEILRLL